MNIRRETPRRSEDNPVAVGSSSNDAPGERFREIVNSLYSANNMNKEEGNEEEIVCHT